MTGAATFPFPFRTDTFRYSTNVEPARVPVDTAAGRWGQHVFDADADYARDLALREAILRRDPSRATVLPHMDSAAWDALLWVLTELAAARPSDFSLTQMGARWHWTNRLAGIEQTFILGEGGTLPCPPLTFAAAQTQDDLVLLDQRDGQLWAGAGVVTFAADWSLGFDVGMSFLDLHAPVPDVLHRERVLVRAHELLLGLEVGGELRRTNWLMTVGRHLDLSTEQLPVWGADRIRLLTSPDREALIEQLQLRTELQHLVRLPLTGAILFTIRTYHLSMSELAAVPDWKQRFQRVLTELPEELIQAKGLTEFHSHLTSWLTAH